MDLKEIAEAYQLVYEKKAKKDYDGDGKIESGKEEYFGSKDKAIKKAMGKDVEENGDDEKDDDNEDSKDLSASQKKLPPQLQKAIAKKGKKSDKKESLDLVSAYHSMYEHHKKDEDGNTIPHEDEIEEGVDLSFVDELSEEELDILVEEVVYDLLDEGIELDAVEGAFTQYLEEAKITFGSDTAGEDEEVGTKTRSKKNPTAQEKMASEVKKKRAEKQKKSQERTEKFKKSVGKAVQGIKAKAHSPLADYAGKRGLIPAKSKMSKPDGRKKLYRGEDGKSQLEKDKAKYAKSKDRKQTSSNIKVSMMGGAGKEKRQGLRSAVFKDVKDRVGKKVQAVKDAPKKAVEGIKKGVGAAVQAVKKVPGKIKDAQEKSKIQKAQRREKAGSALEKFGKSIQVKAESLHTLDPFDTVTIYLVDEGFAKDFDHAQRIMITLDSELIQEVHESQIEALRAYLLNESSASDGSAGGHYHDVGGGDYRSKEQIVRMNNDPQGTKKYGSKMMKGVGTVLKDLKVPNVRKKNESLETAYLKVYEAKVDDKKIFGVAADRNKRRFGKEGAFDPDGSGPRGQDPSERAILANKREKEHSNRRGKKTGAGGYTPKGSM